MWIPDWHFVLTRAWSVRFMVLAAILSGLEVALPYIPLSVPDRTFAILSGVVTAAALISRFVAQQRT